MSCSGAPGADWVLVSGDQCEAVAGLSNFNAATCGADPGHYVTQTPSSGGVLVVTAVDPCPAGSSCAGGTAQPVACAAGSFSATTGASACDLCPAGRFSATTGATQCTDCSPGFYNPSTGAQQCQAAPVGSFVATSGAVTFTQCSAGEFQDQVAQTSCQSCPAGTTSGTGASSCDPDHDSDGIIDALDDDDDNDTVLDADDTCALGELGWTSNSTKDNDGDGCRDATEDDDDDNDGVLDVSDACPLDALKSASSGACGCGNPDVATTYYRDADNDGFGDPGVTESSFTCLAPSAGYVDNDDDCDDTCSACNPLSSEVCDGKDNDCDGAVDNGLAFVDYALDGDVDDYYLSGTVVSACSPPTAAHRALSVLVAGGDCDDADPSRNPGAAEACNTLDDDCDGTVDEDAGDFYALDADGDLYYTGAVVQACSPPSTDHALVSSLSGGGDCDDGDASRNPGATEVCDGVDQDCDGAVDNGLTFVDYALDADGDDYYVTGSVVSACSPPSAAHRALTVLVADGDCDDSCAACNPAGTEVCDGADNDCDGTVDDNVGDLYALDSDGDLYYVTGSEVQSCTVLSPPHYLVSTLQGGGDCDDGDALANPGELEACSGVDNDCNGLVDDNVGDLYAVDGDVDNYWLTGSEVLACAPPSGLHRLVSLMVADGDCDDTDASRSPGATEACNGEDDDCDGSVDNGLSFADYGLDADGDLYYTGAVVSACSPPSSDHYLVSSLSGGGDCDDGDASTHPGATELCDGVDNDCDSTTDEADYTFYGDSDNDGYGSSSSGTVVLSGTCTVPPATPAGFADNDDDCDDACSACNPVSSEVCDGQDNDCDGAVDNGLSVFDYGLDADGDLYYTGAVVSACSPPSSDHHLVSSLSGGGDCDDADAAIHPGATELCDGQDNDCNSLVDDGVVVATISYANNPYCSIGGTAVVTLTGATGGTFSGTAGLVITAGNGNVNLASSTPGTHTVSYTVPANGSCPSQVVTTSITITQNPNATFSYPASPYCTAGGTASPVFVGVPPTGVYSAPPGLSLSSSTGVVTLGTTSAGTYTVQYDVAAGGGCGPYTTTADITVSQATTWYEDADGDGFGDPNASTQACGMPAGYVANATDNCPIDPLKQDPGPCGCNVAALACQQGCTDVDAQNYSTDYLTSAGSCLWCDADHDFDGPVAIGPTQAPDTWYTDRYAPNGFTGGVAFDGGLRLLHHIDAADCQSCRPPSFSSTFYNTQGRKLDMPVGTEEVSIELYVPADWATSGRRMAGFWGTTVNASNVVAGYPIIEFVSDGGTPRFRAYDNGTWFDMGMPSSFTYNSWVTLSMRLLASGEFMMRVGDLSFTTVNFAAGANVRFADLILQGHNTDTPGVTYDIHWDNLHIINESADSDGDLVGDACDVCPNNPNYTTTAGVHNVTQGTFHCTIQGAVDAALPFDTIYVPAGLWVENVVVDRALTLHGANAGTSPNSGVARLPETVVVPAVSGISTDVLFEVTASGVTIDGFMLDGDNVAISSGFSSTNGADQDCAEGVAVYTNNVSDLHVRNNVIRNLSYFGVTLFGASYSAPATTGHVIEDNLFEHMGTYDPGSGISFWGGAVLLYNAQYAHVRGNDMQNVRIGVQTGNFHAPNTGAAVHQVIEDNTMAVRRRGIFHNLHTGSPSPISLLHNTITAVVDPNEVVWDGILLASLDVSSTCVDNDIDGSAVSLPSEGYEVWNVSSVSNPSISGGTVVGVGIGVSLNNYEGYNSDGTYGAHATLSDLSITPRAGGTGIRVHDNPSSSHAPVVLACGTGVSVSGGLHGLVVENSSAQVSALSSTAFSSQSGDHIRLLSNANPIDATTATFDGLTGATASLAQNYAIEDRVLHALDVAGLGLVRVHGGALYVTQLSNSVQRAIDAASSGDVVHVDAGLYTGNVQVSKPLTLLGAQAGVSRCVAAPTESHLAGQLVGNKQTLAIQASDVTVDGFYITGGTAIQSALHEGGLYENNLIETEEAGIAVAGVFSSVCTIRDNCITLTQQIAPIPQPTTIGVFVSMCTGPALVIEDNVVKNSFYGYVLHGVNTSSRTLVQGGSITGVMQGVAVVNYLGSGSPVGSTVGVSSVSMSGFIGDYSLNPSLSGVNFHAGVYTFTTATTGAGQGIDLAVTDVDIQGTLTPSQSSGGIYLGDFSTGGAVVQTVTVDGSTISNNSNRGIDARGHVDLSVTRCVLENNGSAAFGTGGNDGYAVLAQRGAVVSVSNCFLSHPPVSTTDVHALQTGNAPNSSLTAHDNSVLMSGNPLGSGATNGSGTIDATCNWWGSLLAADVAPLMGAGVLYESWLVDGTDDDLVQAGFQPVAGSCTGVTVGCPDPLALNYAPSASVADVCNYCPSSVTDDATISTPILIGSGIPQDHASVGVRCDNMEVGLSAFHRFTGSIVPAGNVYTTTAGNSPTSGTDPTPAAGTARWNFLMSVNLGDHTFEDVQVYLDLDFDPSAAAVYNTVDVTAFMYSQGLQATSLAQSSENFGFSFWQAPPFSFPVFDPFAAGTYDLRVRMLSAATGELLMTVPIQVAVEPVVRVDARVLLEGPYNTITDMMDDQLRAQNLIPMSQPYSGAPWSYAGTETTTAAVFSTTGPDAVVDWVLLELRDKTNSSVVLHRRAALVQRDGSIVDVDGVNPVTFAGVTADDYFVAVRHRGHLGVMTLAAVSLSADPAAVVDFSSVATYGTEAMKPLDGTFVMWGGNAVPDFRLRYTGVSNDRDGVLAYLFANAPPPITVNSIVSGVYATVDWTMDGVVKYTGTKNDRDPILVNIGGSNSTAQRLEQLP